MEGMANPVTVKDGCIIGANGSDRSGSLNVVLAYIHPLKAAR